MAGVLKPVDPLPADPHLLSWGHLMPVVERRAHSPALTIAVPGWVAGVAFSPTGDRLAIASSDAVARIVDPATGRTLGQCRGHDDGIAAVAFHPDGKLLATGSYDHAAAIWNAGDGKRLHRLVGHRGVVTSVAFSPDGKTLATASLDSTVKLWDVATGNLKATLEGHKTWVNSIAFRADGKQLVSGSSDGTLRVWSTETNAVLRTIDATNGEVRTVACSPDGMHLAAGLRYGTVKIWTAADSKECRSVPGQGYDCAVTFSPTGTQIASSEGGWNRGGAVSIRDVATGEVLECFRQTGEVISIAYAPAGNLLAVGAADRTVRLWKLPKR